MNDYSALWFARIWRFNKHIMTALIKDDNFARIDADL